MIRKLQIKFILITMLATIIISGCMFGLIIFEDYKTLNGQTDAILDLIAENQGTIPEYRQRKDNLSKYITPETQFSTRFFTVEIDYNGNIVNTDMRNIATVTHEDVESIINNLEKNYGFYNNFKYKVIEKDNNEMIIFLDCTIQLDNFKSTTQKAIIIIISAWFIILLVISLLSKRILKPIIQNMEKQKQFITNASHELKTPLAVINADIDVLEMTIGEDNNEWLNSIKSQTNRLNILIKSLLNLANVEEGKNKLDISEFSVTNVIKEEICNMKSLIQDKYVEFDDINNIIMKADINLIKQVIIILLDNAIKYTPSNGIIRITLGNNGKYTKLEICNTCENPEKINTKRLFERFYRDDASRNKKKEGYGIGLSIAKSIVDVHKGKITAYINNENMMCFKILI